MLRYAFIHFSLQKVSISRDAMICCNMHHSITAYHSVSRYANYFEEEKCMKAYRSILDRNGQYLLLYKNINSNSFISLSTQALTVTGDRTTERGTPSCVCRAREVPADTKWEACGYNVCGSFWWTYSATEASC